MDLPLFQFISLNIFVIHSAVSNVYSPLDSNNTAEGAHRVLEKLRSRPQNGETWLEMGLDRAGEVFDTATPPRPNARKVLVMFTDGESTSRDYNGLKVCASFSLSKLHRFKSQFS